MTSPTNPQPTPPAGPIPDEVAKMDESKLQGEQKKEYVEGGAKPTGRCYSSVSDLIKGEGLSIQLESEVKPCPSVETTTVGCNAAPADGPNPSPGAAEQPLCPFCQQKPVQWTPDLVGCANKDCPIGGSIFRNESWNTRTPPPVDGSGPTAEEMLDWLEKHRDWYATRACDGTWFWLDNYTGKPKEPRNADGLPPYYPTLRAAIAQAMQSK